MFNEVTVCTPCVGPGDVSRVCADVETKVDCVCSCSCNCNCGDKQWIASLCQWLDPDRALVTKVIVLFPNAINDVAVSWLPRWVQVVDSRTIEQDATFDVVVTWGLLDLVERTSHLTCPTIDVQHGVFMHATWQSPLVAAATRAHELLGTTIVGVNEAVRQNFPEHVRDDVVIIPNGSDPSRVHPLVDRNELKASLGLSPEHKVVVYIGRIAVEKNVQALIDAVEHLDESWHAVIIGPQYVPLERLGPRVHLLPAQRRIGNWLGIADVLCHPSDYESHCFSINEAWLAGVRQWLDGGVQPWRTRLVGVEGFAAYRSPCWDLYDEVVESSIEWFVETNADRWDAILLLDVLEHFEHAQGDAILSGLRSRLSPGGRLFVGTPAVWMDQGAAYGNEFERHRSLWTADELRAVGFELLDGGNTDRFGNQMLLGVAPDDTHQGRRELTLISKPTDHRRARACDG